MTKFGTVMVKGVSSNDPKFWGDLLHVHTHTTQ